MLKINKKGPSHANRLCGLRLKYAKQFTKLEEFNLFFPELLLDILQTVFLFLSSLLNAI